MFIWKWAFNRSFTVHTAIKLTKANFPMSFAELKNSSQESFNTMRIRLLLTILSSWIISIERV